MASIAAADATAATAPPPTAATDSAQDIQAQLAALQAKVAQLEQQQKAMDQQTVAAVQADAAKRSNLLDISPHDVTAGYQNGFYLVSEDKNFLFKPGILLQFRETTNFRQDGKNQGDDDWQNGFEVRRLKLYAEGNAVTPDLTYFFQIDNDRNAAAIVLEDAFVQYKFAPHFAIKAGQYKGPFNREELISDPGQLGVERSLLNDTLGGGVTGSRLQAVSLISGFGGDNLKSDAVHTELAFTDGDNSQNTDFRDNVAATTATDTRPDWGVIGRADYKVFGDWADYTKFSAKTNKSDLLVVGAAFDESENTGNNTTRFTFDALWQTQSKLNVYGAFIGSYGDLRNASATVEDNRFDYGAILQAGYVLTPHWEPFVRGDVTVLDKDVTTGDHVFPELAAGVNYYFGEDGVAFNRCKLTLDATYLSSGSPGDRTGEDFLADNGRNEVVIRAQLQFQL